MRKGLFLVLIWKKQRKQKKSKRNRRFELKCNGGQARKICILLYSSAKNLCKYNFFKNYLIVIIIWTKKISSKNKIIIKAIIFKNVNKCNNNSNVKIHKIKEI